MWAAIIHFAAFGACSSAKHKSRGPSRGIIKYSVARMGINVKSQALDGYNFQNNGYLPQNNSNSFEISVEKHVL